MKCKSRKNCTEFPERCSGARFFKGKCIRYKRKGKSYQDMSSKELSTESTTT